MITFPTDNTDFHRFLTLSEFFAVRLDVYKTFACNEELSVQICEICGRQKRGSGQDEQASVQGDDLTMLNFIPDVPSDYSGLHPADALSLVSDARRLGLLQAYIIVSCGSATTLVGVATSSGSATTLAGVVSTSGILPGIRVGIRGGAIP